MGQFESSQAPDDILILLVFFSLDTVTGEALTPSDASYGWDIEINGELKPLDAVAGIIAAKVMQTTDPDNPQVVMLQLNHISASNRWTKARCRVTVSKKLEDGEETIVDKTYYSPFFSSGSLFDSADLGGQIVTGKSRLVTQTNPMYHQKSTHASRQRVSLLL